jgi:hypothetical protein
VIIEILNNNNNNNNQVSAGLRRGVKCNSGGLKFEYKQGVLGKARLIAKAFLITISARPQRGPQTMNHSLNTGPSTLAPMIPIRGRFYPEWIMFVLGTVGFLLSCLPSLDFGTIRL